MLLSLCLMLGVCSFSMLGSRLLHESLLVPVLTCGSETMIWRKKERSRIRAIQIDNLRGLLSIRRMD